MGLVGVRQRMGWINGRVYFEGDEGRRAGRMGKTGCDLGREVYRYNMILCELEHGVG